jgi:glycerol-3-phosphate dehydrogenase
MGWQQANATVEAAAPRFGLQADTVRFLADYGANALAILGLLKEDATLASRIVPDLPRIMAEVVYACRYEMAMNLDDVLDRRLHITTEDWDHGIRAAPAVAARMAEELGWGPSETDRQIARYKQLVSPAFPSFYGGVSR